MNMKARNIEDRLAVVGAVIVLLGVSFAAEDALASTTDLDNGVATHTSLLEEGQK